MYRSRLGTVKENLGDNPNAKLRCFPLYSLCKCSHKTSLRFASHLFPTTSAVADLGRGPNARLQCLRLGSCRERPHGTPLRFAPLLAPRSYGSPLTDPGRGSNARLQCLRLGFRQERPHGTPLRFAPLLLPTRHGSPVTGSCESMCAAPRLIALSDGALIRNGALFANMLAPKVSGELISPCAGWNLSSTGRLPYSILFSVSR
jgi:hypothetical protein